MRAFCLVLLLACGCFYPYGGGTVPAPAPPPPSPAQPQVRDAPPVEDDEAEPPPRKDRAARTFTLRVLADERVRLEPGWRERAEAAVGVASQTFRTLQLAFRVVSTGTWDKPAQEDSLPMLLDRVAQQPKEGAEVVIGLVGGTGPLPATIDQIGWAQYPEDVAVVRMAAPETLGRVIAHEMAHLLGAVHVEESGSLMRANFSQVGAALDRYNEELVDANRDRRFVRDRPPLSEEHADLALAAVRKILRADRHNRDAEDMRTLLHEYKIRLKAWQREEGAGNDEAAARRKGAQALVDEARRHRTEGRRGKALAFLREALRTDPGCPGAHLELGRDFYDQGKPEDALAELFAEVKVDPSSAEAFYLIGLCHEKAGRAEQAREAFETALRFDPKHIEARAKLGTSP